MLKIDHTFFNEHPIGIQIELQQNRMGTKLMLLSWTSSPMEKVVTCTLLTLDPIVVHTQYYYVEC